MGKSKPSTATAYPFVRRTGGGTLYGEFKAKGAKRNTYVHAPLGETFASAKECHDAVLKVRHEMGLPDGPKPKSSRFA
jgi:hypothetical protein